MYNHLEPVLVPLGGGRGGSFSFNSKIHKNFFLVSFFAELFPHVGFSYTTGFALHVAGSWQKR